MKRCPQRGTDYFDERLEFCLEDGNRLAPVGKTTARTEPFVVPEKSVETFFYPPAANVPKTLEVNDAAALKPPPTQESKSATLAEKAVEKSYRALELGTLVVALAHNWWQWLYLDRQNGGSATAFLFSAQFVVWLLLLLAGTVTGLLAVRLSPSKRLAIAGLVILAVNFLLLLVPRR